jgi:hypothetical protein
VLYSDLVGRQRTISRFGLVPTGDTWLASLNRHWYLDWDGPRPDSDAGVAAANVAADWEAARRRMAVQGSAGPAAAGDGTVAHDMVPADGTVVRDVVPADGR